MNETLKLLSQIINKKDEEKTTEEIAKKYREDLNPSLFALAYKKTYKLIIHISKNYYGLTNQDIVSFALVELDYCLKTYEEGQAEFSTYFTTILKNRLRKETQSLNTQKRKVLFFSESYNQMIEKGKDITDNCQRIENIGIFQDKNLTEKEKVYCKLLIDKYTNTEISKIMDVSIMTLCNMRKRLRKKFI